MDVLGAFDAAVPRLSEWAYALVFLAAVTETLPGFGLLVPGQTVVIAAGAAAAHGYLHVVPVVVLAFVGAVIGDSLAYFAGRQLGEPFVDKWGPRLRVTPASLESAKRFVREHTVKTLIVGRFNSLTRALFPFAAGASRVPISRFALANVVGAAAWALTFTTIGFTGGALIHVAKEVGAEFGAEAVTLVIAVGILVAARAYLHKHGTRLSHYEFAWVIATSIAALAFLKLVLDQDARQFVDSFGPALGEGRTVSPRRLMAAQRAGVVVSLVLLPFIAAVAWPLLKRRLGRAPWRVAILLGGAPFFLIAAKLLIFRPTPEHAYAALLGLLYPSGPAFAAAVLAGAALHVAASLNWHRGLPWAVLVVSALLMALLAIVRLRAGIEGLAGEAAGASLGIFWCGLVIVFPDVMERLEAERFSRVSGIARDDPA